MNEQIKKIRAELERRMKGGCGSPYEYTAYQSILSFIDSLEDNPKRKTFPLFEECLAKVDPEIRKEVSDNIDKILQDSPELNTNLIRTSQEALETLQMAGILDENGELTEPYRSTDMQQREGVNPFDAALMGFTASVMENDGFNFTENSDCIAFDFWKNHLLSVAKKLLNDELATNPNMESLDAKCGKPDEPKKGYDPEYLQSCINKAKKSWKGVDADEFMDEVRGREKSEIPTSLEEAAADCTYHNHAFARESFIEGAKWQKAKDCKISEEIEKTCQNFTKPSDETSLEEEIDSVSKRYPEVSFAKLSRIAKHFAQWGAEHLKK